MKSSSTQWAALLSVVLSLFLTLMGCSVLGQKPSDEQGEWSRKGSFIASYGPVVEPYSSRIRNSYYLYSDSGKQLSAAKGRGSWAPVAITTQSGAYGYFSGSLEQLGSDGPEVSFMKNSPVSFYGHSPEGRMAVAILNDSDSAEFHHSSVVFDGASANKATIPTVPHSLAVGERNALVVGDSVDGNVQRKDLLLLDADGTVTNIGFPSGYDESLPDFKYPHVNYLGDGLFEVLQAATEGPVTNFKSFEVRIVNDSYLETQQVRSFSMSLNDDFAVTRSLPLGENGFIDTSGRVFINHRDVFGPEHTGTIPQFDTDKFVPVNSSTEALLGIRTASSIEIRKWAKPEEIVAEIAYERGACADEACGLSSISAVL